jgi:hypothetical protein
MPTFLSDPAPAFYLVLFGFVVVTGAIAARNQDRKSLLRFAAALAVLLIVFLIDKLVESPREEALGKVQQMMKAANARQPDAFVAQIADTIEYKGRGRTKTITREQLRTAGFWSLLHQHNVRVAGWDYDAREIDTNTVEVGFLAKAEAEGRSFPMYLQGTFTRQPDGKLRLTRFASFDPMKRTNEPITIPAGPFE